MEAIDQDITSTSTSSSTTQQTPAKPLRTHVLEAIGNYFKYLGDQDPIDLQSLVFEEVESALYEAIMRFTKGNQSRAARILGVSRGTLRTKLKRYFGTTHIGHDERDRDN